LILGHRDLIRAWKAKQIQFSPDIQVVSYSPKDADEEFVTLGPLTLLGVAEKYSEYLKGVEYVAVGFGVVICVYTRLGSQILSISLEKDSKALARCLAWLTRKKKALSKR